jgi:signal transduction histidine kinase
MPRPTVPPFNYLASVFFVGAALVLRWILDPWLGDSQPLSLLFGAVALAVWMSGAGPAILATVVGYFASDYLFIPPRGVFAVADAREAISLFTYLVSCIVIMIFGEGMRAANQRAQQYARSLEEHHEQLKRAERNKDEFLATLAHELRTPLAPIRNALTLLNRRGGDDAALGSARQIIERQVQFMTRLIDDLLDVSRIAAGRLHLKVERIDVQSIVSAAIEIARPLIDTAGHELRVTGHSEPILLQGDHTRLTQVLLNLLSNAARYTPRGGHVELERHTDGEWAIIRVRDDGIGIPPEMLPRVFEMFMQLDRRTERTQGGLGIGLTLARRLLAMHGGSIEASSAGTGRGSEFTVRLPRIPHEEDRGSGALRRSTGQHAAPRVTISAKAANEGADLIVLAKHGHSFIGEMFLGGATRHTVARAK